ncbi:MAG: hypothetical protein ABJG68_12035 [Crocinitomicaceae bacterium]
MSICKSEIEARAIAERYFQSKSNLSYKINNTQHLENWIDGNRKIDHPVWVVNCVNMKESVFEGNHFLSIVIHPDSGEILDSFAH